MTATPLPAPHPGGDGPSDDELVAILVERGVPETVARQRVSQVRRQSPEILNGRGEPIAIDEAEIDAWLSAGSFG